MRLLASWVYNTARSRTFLLLFFATLFCFAVYRIRVEITDTWFFLFLVWNLFLAWIPFGISTLMEEAERQKGHGVMLTLLGLGWLLFFPNSPYILTDLLHLKPRHSPFWLDLLLLLSFAYTGLMLGLHSLAGVQRVVTARLGTAWAKVTIVAALCLSGFGIYLGRFGRWNSWDALTHPDELLHYIAIRLMHPDEHPRTIGVTVGFALFLLMAYGFHIHTTWPAKAMHKEQST